MEIGISPECFSAIPISCYLNLYQDGYYYYLTPLNEGKSTKSLLSAVTFSTRMGNLYKDSRITLTVNMEIVQSNYNGATVFDATGWPAQSPLLEQGGGV